MLRVIGHIKTNKKSGGGSVMEPKWKWWPLFLFEEEFCIQPSNKFIIKLIYLIFVPYG